MNIPASTTRDPASEIIGTATAAVLATAFWALVAVGAWMVWA